MGLGFLSRVMNVLKLIVVLVGQFCGYTKNHWIVYFKRVIAWYVIYHLIKLLKKVSQLKKILLLPTKPLFNYMDIIYITDILTVGSRSYIQVILLSFLNEY